MSNRKYDQELSQAACIYEGPKARCPHCGKKRSGSRTFKPSRVSSGELVRALTERLERRLREVMHAKPNYRERQGRVNELIWAMRDIRAYVKERPNGEVINVPGEDYKWLIRMPDGSVRYTFACNSSGGIDDMEVFTACKP